MRGCRRASKEEQPRQAPDPVTGRALRAGPRSHRRKTQDVPFLPPAWLQHAHAALDAAVFAAYGWPADLTDEEVLGRLLDLNRARATDPSAASWA